jgi:hypothetical protein
MDWDLTVTMNLKENGQTKLKQDLLKANSYKRISTSILESQYKRRKK